ncbi:hypothetical protein N9C10_01345 [Flavobacteriaceae bacterium]|nr:hypothetical protein [Flavobacteriaceae bacterium]
MNEKEKLESKISDLNEMKLLKQREIEWVNLRIKFYEKKMSEIPLENQEE